MRLVVKQALVLLAGVTLFAGQAVAKPGKTTSTSSKHSHRHGKRKASWKRHGQQGIEPERAREIQAALIREKYMTGTPTGRWDATTQAALVRFQADNGWQTKVTPDSRALIKLGLGPDHSQALNAPAGKTSAETLTSSASRAAASTSSDKQ